MEFMYHMPAKIFFGENCIRKHGDAVKDLGHKALIVTGHRSAKASGALDDVVAVLSANGQEYSLFDRVDPNPTIDSIYAGADQLEKEGCDFVWSIGGGSPMDAGKAIALVAGQHPKREDLFDASKYTKAILPIVAVPTTAGTGSEVTRAAVLTNDAAKTKSSITYEGIFPAVSFCDGRYTRDLSHNTTVNTVVDALSHAIEGYLNVKASPITDLYAGESIRVISDRILRMKEDRLTDEDRDQLLYASTLAGMVIANTGTTAVHAMGYPLTYYRHIPHGRANGLLLPSLLRFYQSRGVKRLDNVLDWMGLVNVDGFGSILDSLMGERESFTEEELKTFTATAAKAHNIPACIVRPTEDDILNIYRDAFRM